MPAPPVAKFHWLMYRWVGGIGGIGGLVGWGVWGVWGFGGLGVVWWCGGAGSCKFHKLAHVLSGLVDWWVGLGV